MKPLGTDFTDTAERYARMTEAFRDLYGTDSEVGVRAPGRVDLMGSHTDYNEGFVMTLPINREIWILARPRDDGLVRMVSLNMNAAIGFDTKAPKEGKLDDWGVYAQAVAIELQKAGFPLTGCDAVVHGTVPLSSGLSSSAALEAAVATLFEQLGDYEIDPVEKAKLTQRAENVWVGVNCGILDQYSSILGERHKTLILDCRSLTHHYAAMPRDLRVVICNTNAPRNLSGSEYGDRRAQCEQGAAFFAKQDPSIRFLRDVPLDLFEQHEAGLPELVARRSRFIIEENARVAELAEALEGDKREVIKETTSASFTGCRDLFEISVPAMQAMIEAMSSSPGVVGCRQAGAGFGGCMVAIVEKDAVEDFCSHTAATYQAAIGLNPEIYPIRTAPGAGVLAHD
ncbi:MAG: galactokinase [Woeseiaceae bacterium]